MRWVWFSRVGLEGGAGLSTVLFLAWDREAGERGSGGLLRGCLRHLGLATGWERCRLPTGGGPRCSAGSGGGGLLCPWFSLTWCLGEQSQVTDAEGLALLLVGPQWTGEVLCLSAQETERS